MAEQTERKEGIEITVGLDTDEDSRIWSEDFSKDPPQTAFRFILKNLSDHEVRFTLPSRAKACFAVLDEDLRRLWTYPGRSERTKAELVLNPGDVYEKRIDAPWQEAFMKPGPEYTLEGWLNGHPHLRVSVKFTLAIREVRRPGVSYQRRSP
jgi:hypothetical protein